MVSARQKDSTTEGEHRASSFHCWWELRKDKAKKAERKKELVINKARFLRASAQMSTALRTTRVIVKLFLLSINSTEYSTESYKI